MDPKNSLHLANETATTTLGAQLAQEIAVSGGVITLQGDLGTGKTCLVRSLLQALGHVGRVVSPTYTLMEPYEIAGRQVYHLDLYRLSDPEELAYLGLRDIDPLRDLILVEWPEKGGRWLPAADLALVLEDGVPNGREIKAAGHSQKGKSWWDLAVQHFEAII